MAQQQGVGIKQQIGEKNYQQVIDALESGNIRSLPAGVATSCCCSQIPVPIRKQVA
jgi:hypothetical protein